MHLSTSIALELIEGRLGKDDEVRWKRHMEGCPQCTQDAFRWQQLAAALKRPHLENAPDQDLVNALRIFQHAKASAKSSVRSILASVVFDSFMQPAMAGVRGAPPQTARQIVMRAEEFDIHLKIWGDPGHRQMLGQLLRRDGTDFVRSAQLRLLRSGNELECVSADETGEFHFGDVPDGDLSLQIDLPHLTAIGPLKAQETL